MLPQRQICEQPLHGQRRSGATLVEVLMSILVLSVGVTAVLALFPATVIKSLRATQLTNAKLLEGNVTETLRLNPQFVYPPIDETNLVIWNPVSPTWRPNATYAVNHAVMPNTAAGQLLPSPFGVAVATSVTGPSGAIVNRWPSTGFIDDFSVTGVASTKVQWSVPNYLTTPLTVGGQSLSQQHYIVDPLGRHRDGLNSAMGFGTDGLTNTVQANSMIRTDGGLKSFAAALPHFGLEDTWSVELEALPVLITPGTTTLIQFPASTKMPSLGADPALTRIVLTNASGSERRNAFLAAPITGTTISVQGTFPATLTGAARIESFTPRYTYFLTVKRPSLDSPPRVNVAVVFNRSFSPLDERLVEASVNGGVLGGSDNISVGWSRGPGLKDPTIIEAQLAGAATNQGSYLFDTVDCEWYRVQSYELTTDTATAAVANLVLDRPMRNTADVDLTDSDAGVMFLPGIVHVFSINL